METRDEFSEIDPWFSKEDIAAIRNLQTLSSETYEAILLSYRLDTLLKIPEIPMDFGDDFPVPKDNTSIFKVPALPSTKRKRGDKRDNEHGNQENKRFNPGKSGP